MAFKPITTPAGSIVQGNNGRAQLVWDPNFAARRNETFTKQQRFIDSEVLRRCSPLVPFDTGALEKSGKLGTVIGSGEVDYIAPYAAVQYYNTPESRGYDPNRGSQWFERMKASDKDEILEGAKKLE